MTDTPRDIVGQLAIGDKTLLKLLGRESLEASLCLAGPLSWLTELGLVRERDQQGRIFIATTDLGRQVLAEIAAEASPEAIGVKVEGQQTLHENRQADESTRAGAGRRAPPPTFERDKEFVRKLAHAINSCSRENGSDTPDFVLGAFLFGCLQVFDLTMQRREKWYGRDIGGGAEIVSGPKPDADKIVREEWQRAVALHGLKPASITEEVVSRIINRIRGLDVDDKSPVQIVDPESALISHAREELKRAEFGAEDSEVMIDLLRRFTDQWDSGGAVHAVAPVFQRLLAFKCLTPLLGTADEWHDPGIGDVLQNKRCSTVFKTKDGLGMPYDIGGGEREFIVSFPYWPRHDGISSPVVTVSMPDPGGPETRG